MARTRHIAKPLTQAEKQWLTDLQAVLDACPSDRLGAYTVGDHDVGFFDSNVCKAWLLANPRAELDVGEELRVSGADLKASIRFPFNVDSRSG
ncbi:hypothetical protein [Comamonas thiooxydans]|uniref:hypothetical protein n=1 Tax=Comamonas thiooxydans TaxID=363952 RepID=UPI000B412AA7|nr:hypothetical protein [Comamonas thiooxydans]